MAVIYGTLLAVFWWAADMLGWAHPARFGAEVVLVMVALALWHEVGHGVVGVRLGERWERVEAFSGGFRAVLETHGRRTQHDQLLISLAGPLTGMAGAAVVATATLAMSTWRNPLLWGAAGAIVMDLSNLLPLLPGSDGRKALTGARACARGHGRDLVPGQTPDPEVIA